MTRVIGDSLEVTGAVDLDSTLTVDGVASFSGNVNSFQMAISATLMLASGGIEMMNAGGASISANSEGVVLSLTTLGQSVLELTSPATNDNPTEKVYQNRVATSNNTVTTLHTFTLASNTTYSFDVWVTARRTAGSGVGAANDGAGVHMNGTYKGMTGTATIVGTLTVLSSNLDTSMAAVTMDVSGATVRVRVTGTTNNTITWHMTARVYSLSS